MLRTLERGQLIEPVVRPFKHLPKPAASPNLPARPDNYTPIWDMETKLLPSSGIVFNFSFSYAFFRGDPSVPLQNPERAITEPQVPCQCTCNELVLS